MRKLFLLLSATLLVFAFTSGIALAEVIHVTLTYVDGQLVKTPPGPYFKAPGDFFEVENNTDFPVTVQLYDADDHMHGNMTVEPGQTDALPLQCIERWVCYSYNRGIRGSTTEFECDQLIPINNDWPNHKMHYPQLPDPNGWDVRAMEPTSLADDWRCSETGPIDDIHFWGSWKDDIIGEIEMFVITIHDNIPVGPFGYSVPGNIICGPMYVPAADIIVTPVEPPSPQGWYDPITGEIIPDDHQQYFRYDYYSPGMCTQVQGEIYWLRISAFVIDPANTQWGWKSTLDHFMDDAVWAPLPDAPIPPDQWIEIYEPYVPPDPIINGFGVTIDPQGTFGGGYGDDPYPGGEQESGWWYYQFTEWWNIWFYDHPLDPNRKKDFSVDGILVPFDPGLPTYIEIAINWSTDQWEPGGPPPIPDFISDPSMEDVWIGREVIFVYNDLIIDPIPISSIFEWLPYNPEWVSIDVRGFNFVFEGTIEHTCLPREPQQQSLDLAFVITGESAANIPTLSQWGILILALLLLMAGTIAVIRKRKEVTARTR